ncbi:glycosyltransferase [Maribacter arcticus]|uniref:Glycosyltransferase involved in cell wall bisynthesis n=1 Tax=Maribacter arcticus TaxID=561365 RepID=A0A1T5BI00_9FLAO|nr:glycosyltransferase [Maribacter arcticus]SKB46620.1 Glycosyltransferase involved in cell wall bisynthesis [Maribacter arcticus]
MKLSIIIPLYNKEKYIERCLQSLLNQGLASNDYEIIIVDDGSKDSSVDAVNTYAKKNGIVNIKLIQQINQGPSAARNNGLLEAKGDYIYFLDADDLLSKHALSYLITLSKENDLDILEFDTKEIEEGKLSGLPDSSLFDTKEIKVSVMEGKSFIAEYDLRNQAWRYLIKRKFLLDTDILFLVDMRAYEDLIFTASVFLLAKRISKVSVDAHRYIKVAGSIVTSKNPEKNLEFILGMVKAVEELDNLIKKYDESKENNALVINKLKAKQQAVVYALLIRAFKYKLNPKDLSAILDKMNTLEAYPIDYNKGGIGKLSLIQKIIFFPLVNNRTSLLLGLKIIRKLKFL